MGKKRDKKEKNLPFKNPSRTPVFVEIIYIYLVIILGIIIIILHYDLPLKINGKATAWLNLILVVYYIFPFLLAVTFGIAFRPFWKNVRNVLVIIFAIQIFFSFTVFILRYNYAARQSLDLYQTRLANLKIIAFSHELHISEDNGRIDKIIFHGKFDMRGFPNGMYRLTATIVNQDSGPDEYKIGSFVVLFDDKTPANEFTGHYQFDLTTCPEAYQSGAFDVNIRLEREFQVNNHGKRILAVARWAPFFRNMDWDEADSEITDKSLGLDHLNRVDTFSILALSI